MKPLQPIIVTHLFPEILAELLALLANLSTEAWEKPTVCEGWSVKDTALHLLGDDVGILSRKRDGYLFSGKAIENWDELVALINHLNDIWVQATRRTSPRLLCDLLKFTGEQVCEYFQSLDPYALGDPVNWVGPEPAPVWLDLAREYTERWHHQQQIRDAVDKPDLMQPKFFTPVLDGFVRAWPHTFREINAPDDTLVTLTISGEAGGQWNLLREDGRWHLYLDISQAADAEVVIPQDIAWRLFSKGINPNEAQNQTTITGNKTLGLKVLAMVSVIA